MIWSNIFTHLFQIILSTNIAESSITVSDVKYGQFFLSSFLSIVTTIKSSDSRIVGFV